MLPQDTAQSGASILKSQPTAKRTGLSRPLGVWRGGRGSVRTGLTTGPGWQAGRRVAGIRPRTTETLDLSRAVLRTEPSCRQPTPSCPRLVARTSPLHRDGLAIV